MAAIRLQVVIPFHQPSSTSEEALESACDSCYVPLIDQLESWSGARASLHFSGHILDYLSRRRQELLLRIKALARGGQVELLGGAFYGGPPALLPELDTRGQIEMMAEYWESFVGTVPRGMWLPELAWCRELPRLLDETGIEYAFVSDSQVIPRADAIPPLGVIERGGQRIAAFVLDSDLSRQLPGTTVDEWTEAVIDRAGKLGRSLISVWVRAESLGLEPGTQAWCLEQGWNERFFAVLGGSRTEIRAVLPADSMQTQRPAECLQVDERIASELAPEIGGGGQPTWTDFVAMRPEVDAVYRRMLRVGDKLRDAITTMEEEGLEEDWSDVLATAQRMVFAAQAPDPYWRGPTPGFSDPAVRDAAVDRLLRAEAIIDALVQGEEDWIAAEEEDRDGDLIEEIFVANRLISAWLVPADGAAVRALDDRRNARTVLDVANRRVESFFSAMAQAPSSDEPPAPEPPRRGERLRRLSAELPTTGDEASRQGIREHLLDADAAVGEFAAGVLTGGSQPVAAEVLRNEIDEEDDGTYFLSVRLARTLEGVRPRKASIEKTISIPIDSCELTLDYAVSLEGEGGAIVGVECPVRLAGGATRLSVNGSSLDFVEAELSEAAHVLLQAADGSALELHLEPALDVWVAPIWTTVRDLEGYRAIEQGALLVPLIRVEDRATAKIRIVLAPELA